MDLKRLGSGRAALTVAVLAAAILIHAPRVAADNLLTNGDFSSGHDNLPQGWRARVSLPTTEYNWIPPNGLNPGAVEIVNHIPGDGRWVQSVHLQPGWYYISSEISVTGVPQGRYGASIGLTDETVSAPDRGGSGDWQRAGFYLQVGPSGAYVEVALRLGEYWDLNSGRAEFRGVNVTPVDAPPEGAFPTYSLDDKRLTLFENPIGPPLALAVLALCACAGWLMRGKGAAVGTAECRVQEPVNR
jgi:hypothetical protein